MMGERDPVPIRDVLRDAGTGTGIDAPLEAGRLWRAWPTIVGAAVAEHTEPSSLRKGVLRVRTDSPTWATEIAYLSAHLIEQINAALGATIVREIGVWTTPDPIRRLADAQDSEVDKATDRRSEDPAARDPVTAFMRVHNAWARRRRRR